MDKKEGNRFNHYRILLTLPIAVILLDQLTKFMVRSCIELNQSIPIINNIFHLTYVTNTGILFGLFKNTNALFIWLTIIIIGAILFLFERFDRTEKVCFSIILGSAIGNLIDRLTYGHVIDFLDLRFWPVFNIADMAISCTIMFLVVYYIFYKK